MSASQPRVAAPSMGAHPAVVSRRIAELALLGGAGAIVLGVALGIALAVPDPNFALVLALAFGAVGIIALAVNSRLEISVALLAIYLGALDGPVKLLSANQAASAVRDVLIAAVALGAIVRLLARRERVALPPMSGWVIAFVALVLADAFNPNTLGTLKILGGLRQELEWVPFFFFGYVLMRSRKRFRQLFLILGVIALANGAVSLYQTRLEPAQLASWGPGYSELVYGNETLSARKYLSEGVARVRPPALGSDAGFGGSVGVIALAGAVVLLATVRRRRRWFAALLCVGALLAIATSLARLSVLGAVISLLAFGLLCAGAGVGRRMRRPLGALLSVAGVAVALGVALVAFEGGGVFSRYVSISPSNVGSTSTTYKAVSLAQIPNDIVNDPFGFGLGDRRCGVELRRAHDGDAGRPRPQRRDAVQLRRRRTGAARPAAVERALAERDLDGRHPPAARRRRRDPDRPRGRVRGLHRADPDGHQRAGDGERGCWPLLLVCGGDRRLLAGGRGARGR